MKRQQNNGNVTKQFQLMFQADMNVDKDEMQDGLVWSTCPDRTSSAMFKADPAASRAARYDACIIQTIHHGESFISVSANL